MDCTIPTVTPLQMTERMSTAPLPVSASTQDTGTSTGSPGMGQIVAALRTRPLLIAGVLALIIPTLIRLANESWATEDGAHGPIVLASGLWLLWHKWPEIAARARPGSFPVALAGAVASMALYLLGRVVGVLSFEMAGLAGAIISLMYASVGSRAILAAWFPLFYLAFVIPLPESIVALITQPLKLGISQTATVLLQMLGYPVANTGVILQVAQYELLVAAACSGLNALITLTALGLFYAYVLHQSTWRYCLLLMCAAIPAAIFANFVRVIVLILITYYMGDAAGQGYLHDMAGITTFIVALLFLFAVDRLLTPLRKRLDDRPDQHA